MDTYQPGYVVISPVRDEEEFVEGTLRSMLSQTVKPVLWVIVDDGSSDGTGRIVKAYAEETSWIRVVRRERSDGRQPGGGVIRAFDAGYRHACELVHELVVKLDCDVTFGPDYFEKLLREFEADKSLGIASGIYLERSDDGDWKEVTMPSYHAAGASKVVRRKCFDAIGGFIATAGWDTVDEIRAINVGWRTRHFRDLKMKHWKLEGSGVGSFRTAVMHGEIFYLTGGSRLGFGLKLLRRAARRPVFLGGAGLFWGYLRAVLGRRPRLVTKEEATTYRRLLNVRLRTRLSALIGISSRAVTK